MRSGDPPSVAPSASAGAAPAVSPRMERYLCRLEEFSDLAMMLGRREAEVGRAAAEPAAAEPAAAEPGAAAGAKAEATPAPAADPPRPAPPRRDPSLAFCRYFKAVRLSTLVTAKIEADAKRDAAAGRRDRDRGRGGGKTARRKKEVKRLIESSLVTEGTEEDREEAVREALERLDRMEFADDDDRPVGHIVEEICNALGVGFDGRQWTDEELGLGWPGWPEEFAEFRDAGPPPMPPRGGSDRAAGGGTGRSDGDAGSAKPAESAGTTAKDAAPKEGKAPTPPAGSSRQPASPGVASWYFEPAPFSLKDQISRDCGLTDNDGEATPDIDPCPD